MWLSAAAWSKFVDKRLEGANMEMQSDLQSELADYLAEMRGDEDDDDPEDAEQDTINFNDLSHELQSEFLAVQSRAQMELGPVAMQRAIQMQFIIQAKSDAERLNLLKDCVDTEIRRLEAKRMLRLAVIDYKDDERPRKSKLLLRKEARLALEELMKTETKVDARFPDDAFQ
jgi:hypothetical protein